MRLYKFPHTIVNRRKVAGMIPTLYDGSIDFELLAKVRSGRRESSRGNVNLCRLCKWREADGGFCVFAKARRYYYDRCVFI